MKRVPKPEPERKTLEGTAYRVGRWRHDLVSKSPKSVSLKRKLSQSSSEDDESRTTPKKYRSEIGAPLSHSSPDDVIIISNAKRKGADGFVRPEDGGLFVTFRVIDEEVA
ncbi:hypothetical protein SCARD494_04016 [Seiridium cardinale]